MSVGLSCGHLTRGVCLRCENVSLRAQAQKAVAEVERLREALEGLLRVSLHDATDEAARRVARAVLAGEEGTP